VFALPTKMFEIAGFVRNLTNKNYFARCGNTGGCLWHSDLIPA